MGGLVQRILMFVWKGGHPGRIYSACGTYVSPKPSDHHVFEPLHETGVPSPFLLVDVTLMLARLRDCSTCSCDPILAHSIQVPVARPYLHAIGIAPLECDNRVEQGSHPTILVPSYGRQGKWRCVGAICRRRTAVEP